MYTCSYPTNVTQWHRSAARNSNCFMIFINLARYRYNEANSLKSVLWERTHSMAYFNMHITLFTHKCSKMMLTLRLMTQTSHCFEGCQTTLNWQIFICLDVKFNKIKRPKDMPFCLMYFLQDTGFWNFKHDLSFSLKNFILFSFQLWKDNESVQKLIN